jgi:hypothetical protein
MAGQWISWQEQHLLQLLGRGVVSHWDQIPQAVRNDLLKVVRCIDDGYSSAETEQIIEELRRSTVSER